MKKLILITFLFANAAFGQSVIKGGTVYKKHPDIEVVKNWPSFMKKVMPKEWRHIMTPR
jgi:hypothetical protein